MKRVVVDRFGGPEVLKVVDEAAPRPGPREVLVRVIAAGVSFTDTQLRAGTYIGGPRPPFTPGYELVGMVEALGPQCKRLRPGDRVGALTVWGANAEQVCVPEKYTVNVPGDLDPAGIVSLIFPYMTAYQLLHRVARVRAGESVLVHGAAGRVGIALLELGKVAGLRLFGTASRRDCALLERLGVVAIDYAHDDFVARLRELAGGGVDVVLDGIGGTVSLRSFRVLRRGGRLVVFGRYDTIAHGVKNWPAVFKWYAATAAVALAGLVMPGRRVNGYRIQKLRIHHQDWFREDFLALTRLLRSGDIHPIVAHRLPFTEARRAHELLEETAAVGKIVLVP